MKPNNLVTFATAGITLFGLGFWYGSNLSFKKNEPALEQIVAPAPAEIPQVPEVCNIGLSAEEKELIFYSGAMEILNNINNELDSFNENLKSYAAEKETNSRLMYLAQAKESMNSIYRNLFVLTIKHKNSPFVSQKFVQTIYNIQYSHSQFMQSYLDELEGVFANESNLDIQKFSGENKNIYDFERELTSAMSQARRKIEDR